MAIVSISEAARLTGKARSTIQAQIKAGKLSKTTDSTTHTKGIDTSELIRVFGSLNNTSIGSSEDVATSQQTTANATQSSDPEKEALKAENKRLSDLLEAKQETIDSLNNAMRLLEDQRQKTQVLQTAPQEEPKQEEKKGFFQRLFRS